MVVARRLELVPSTTHSSIRCRMPSRPTTTRRTVVPEGMPDTRTSTSLPARRGATVAVSRAPEPGSTVVVERLGGDAMVVVQRLGGDAMVEDRDGAVAVSCVEMIVDPRTPAVTAAVAAATPAPM